MIRTTRGRAANGRFQRAAPAASTSAAVDCATAPLVPVQVQDRASGPDAGTTVPLLRARNGPMTNEPPTAVSHGPGSTTQPWLSLHAFISPELRTQIWAGDFIELPALLFHNRNVSQSYSLCVESNSDYDDQTYSLTVHPQWEVLSFMQWVEAFQIFMSVYVSHPTHLPNAPKMLKYIDTIRRLADQDADWHGYDRTFRSLRGQFGWPWDSINFELWIKATSPNRYDY